MQLKLSISSTRDCIRAAGKPSAAVTAAGFQAKATTTIDDDRGYCQRNHGQEQRKYLIGVRLSHGGSTS